MSGLDDLLGGLLGGGGKGGGDLSSVLGGLTGGGTGGSGGGGNQMLAALIPMVGSLLASGGLQKLLSGFQAKGMSAQADSWVGTGANEPVTGAQVKEVVGEGQVSEIAQQLGVSEDQAADALAEVLPQVVDRASPDGQLAPQEDLDQAFDQLRQSAQTA